MDKDERYSTFKLTGDILLNGNLGTVLYITDLLSE